MPEGDNIPRPPELPKKVDFAAKLKPTISVPQHAAPSLPPNPFAKEATHLRDPNIEQKMRDTFSDYPLETRNDIADALETMYGHWKKSHRTDLDVLEQVNLNRVIIPEGFVYNRGAPREIIPARPLNPEEIEANKRLLEVLAPFGDKGEKSQFGVSANGLPDTRLYLSLRDTPTTADMMIELTQQLASLHQDGTIPFWHYKFDSTDQDGHIRFDPRYRDKGGAPIVYVHDSSLTIVSNVMEGLYKKFPHVFLPQKAPFKYSPHNQEYDVWHVAMANDQSMANSTPETGMKKALSNFIKGIGLTTQQIPIYSINPQVIRSSWENACQGVARDPQKPWTVTSRPLPDFFKGK